MYYQISLGVPSLLLPIWVCSNWNFKEERSTVSITFKVMDIFWSHFYFQEVLFSLCIDIPQVESPQLSKFSFLINWNNKIVEYIYISHIHTYILKHVYVCICMYVCIYVCIYVCMYVSMNTIFLSLWSLWLSNGVEGCHSISIGL